MMQPCQDRIGNHSAIMRNPPCLDGPATDKTAEASGTPGPRLECGREDLGPLAFSSKANVILTALGFPNGAGSEAGIGTETIWSLCVILFLCV